MKEKPILFKTEMVKAILENRKFQTRRIITPQPNIDFHYRGWYDDNGTYEFTTCHPLNVRYPNQVSYAKAKYKRGDHLWVRETWNYDGGEANGRYTYRANYGDNEYSWKPSIHMPKHAARLWLEVTGITISQVKDITEDDAIREGMRQCEAGLFHWDLEKPGQKHYTTAREAFIKYWILLSKGTFFNYWVFVYEFKRLPHEIKEYDRVYPCKFILK